MDAFQNMELFSELIQCGGNIYTWCYNADGSLLQSNCPEAGFLSGAFEIFGCKKKMLDSGSRHTTPVTLGTAIGMTWAAAFEKDGSALKRAWVIGPVFYQDVSLRGIEHGLQYYNRLETSVAWTMQLYEVLKTVPVLQCTVLHRYALMMHYCLTGNHLTISDINSESLAQGRSTVQQPAHDRHKVYMAEQGLLQMVRTGDLNYKQALSASMGISADDLDPLALMMYDDFVRRVHKCRTNPHLSQQVQKCVDYIEMNLDKKIRAADLAALVGYTEYYLTHKFKEETGLSVTDYIKFAKIERAKVLLKSTDQTVQDIAAALSFSTRNYFSRIFQEVTGQTPMEYREK